MAPKAVYLHGAMLDPNATVDALIDGNTKWWNSTLLGAIFTQEEVSLIQSIPVSASNREDVCIWRGTKAGIFSVKIAYHLQMELDGYELAECSTRGEDSRVWQDLWALNVPNVGKKISMESMS
jgi:hypothetical protein